MELLIQAARDPILRAAALDVDAAIFAKDQLIEEYAMITGELAYRLNREGKLG